MGHNGVKRAFDSDSTKGSIDIGSDSAFLVAKVVEPTTSEDVPNA